VIEIDLKKIEQEWKRRRFSFGLWVDPPGQAWEDYVHATDELFMVLEGEVELEMEGRVLRPRPGERGLDPGPHFPQRAKSRGVDLPMAVRIQDLIQAAVLQRVLPSREATLLLGVRAPRP